MNLIIVTPADFCAEKQVRLTGRRFDHWREVLRASEQCKIGLLDGGIGIGRLTAADAASAVFEVEFVHDPPPPSPGALVIALPRPKTLRKVLYAAVGFGVRTIYCIAAWKVEKSYWQSPWLEPAALREWLLETLEQAVDTRLPAVHFRPRFKPFVEDELPGVIGGGGAWLAHPGDYPYCPCDIAREGAYTLILGPEGGFTDYEVGKFVAAGARPVQLGPRILRTETAVAALLGRLEGR